MQAQDVLSCSVNIVIVYITSVLILTVECCPPPPLYCLLLLLLLSVNVAGLLQQAISGL